MREEAGKYRGQQRNTGRWVEQDGPFDVFEDICRCVLSDEAFVSAMRLHPLADASPLRRLTSAPIKELYRQIFDAVVAHTPWIYVETMPEGGLSSAAHIIGKRLKADIHEVAVHHCVIFSGAQKCRSGDVLGELLASFSLTELNGSVVDKRFRLTNAFLDKYGGNHVPIYLLVDQSQYLTPIIVDELSLLGARLLEEGLQLGLMFFGAATDESDMRNLFAQRLASELPSTMLRLGGYGEVYEIMSLLQCIDSQRDETGRTWTQFFVPRLFAAGYRLEGEASGLFEAMEEQARIDRLPVSVRRLFIAIKRFLVYAHGFDGTSFKGTVNAWRWALGPG
ncbi:hypothetical protein B0G80_5912 [Paraburkholderia sp. BL6669N2]|uniref:hypothetical protein n=1 Tax=Paraburkholderia sp. BL6669N2 TaxID=1938807 RepID=UPI000E25BD6B|nr:hypothetical protein [Paraburkholderia sp. BL6669N2]REG49538.1 hypothetical protein B0G80_5912 [Paraburkholderia sp. BL6669N2]